MRRSIRTALALAVVGGTLALSAPAQAASAPALEFASPPTPDFGSVAVGESSAERTFTVTNRGGKATGSLKVALTGTVFTIPAGGDLCTGVSLGPKKSCAVTVQYTPAAGGANDTATLTVSSKKPAASASLNLTGTSPAAISAGCLYLQENPIEAFGQHTFRAGDIITLTTPNDGGFIGMYDGFTLLAQSTSPTPATYTVLSDRSISLGYSVDMPPATWSCTPAAANTNIAPVAFDDIDLVKEDASPNSVIGNVLTNDTDADGDAVVVTGTGTFTLSHGILAMNADGSYTYTLDNSDLAVNALNDGQTLTDSFTYNISDGHGGTDSASLSIAIRGTTD